MKHETINTITHKDYNIMLVLCYEIDWLLLRPMQSEL